MEIVAVLVLAWVSGFIANGAPLIRRGAGLCSGRYTYFRRVRTMLMRHGRAETIKHIVVGPVPPPPPPSVPASPVHAKK